MPTAARIYGRAAFTAVLWSDPNLSRGTDGLQTRRWRKPDSNFWSLSTLMPLALAK
jgi:hypothetical protein